MLIASLFSNCSSIYYLSLVEVYNCKVGSSDCSQCWGREDQGHLCGWCENSCKPRDDCQPIINQCPAPEIHKVRSQTNSAWMYFTGARIHTPTDSTSFSSPPPQTPFFSLKIVNRGHSHGAVAPCPVYQESAAEGVFEQSLINAACSVITLALTEPRPSGDTTGLICHHSGWHGNTFSSV